MENKVVWTKLKMWSNQTSSIRKWIGFLLHSEGKLMSFILSEQKVGSFIKSRMYATLINVFILIDIKNV